MSGAASRSRTTSRRSRLTSSRATTSTRTCSSTPVSALPASRSRTAPRLRSTSTPVPADLRQVRVRLRRLVLLVPGRPVLQRRRPDLLAERRRRSAELNGNVAKADWSFWRNLRQGELRGHRPFVLGAFVYYSPNVLNTGADGLFFGGNAKYTFPAISNGMQWYVSGEAGYWDLGTSDAFYGPARHPVRERHPVSRATPPGAPASAGPGRCSRWICATSTPT